MIAMDAMIGSGVGAADIPVSTHTRAKRATSACTHKSAFCKRDLVNVRFALKATEVLRCRKASLCARSGHPGSLRCSIHSLHPSSGRSAVEGPRPRKAAWVQFDSQKTNISPGLDPRVASCPSCSGRPQKKRREEVQS